MLVIRDWDKTFETAKTRKLVRPRYFSCPTGVDSSGYIELMAHGESGIRAFGIFIAICQWSATRRPEDRGKLAREGTPLEDRQLATYLRVETCHLSAALQLLTSKEIGWLVEVENNETCHSSPKTCHSSPNMGSPATQVGRLERSRRGVGEEGEGVDGGGSATPPPAGFEFPEAMWKLPGFRQAWNEFDSHLAAKGNPLTDAQRRAYAEKFQVDGIEKALADLRFSVQKGARTLLDSEVRFDRRDARGHPMESVPTGPRKPDAELRRNTIRAGVVKELRKRGKPTDDATVEAMVDRQLELEAAT